MSHARRKSDSGRNRKCQSRFNLNLLGFELCGAFHEWRVFRSVINEHQTIVSQNKKHIKFTSEWYWIRMLLMTLKLINTNSFASNFFSCFLSCVIFCCGLFFSEAININQPKKSGSQKTLALGFEHLLWLLLIELFCVARFSAETKIFNVKTVSR